jgi:malic enzyme
VAGLLGAMRVLCKPPEAIAKQKVVCVGAGSAGMGVVRMIAAGKSCVSSCLPPAGRPALVLLQLFHWGNSAGFVLVRRPATGHEATA